MRSIKVLPNGTAYIMCYNIANYGSSINLDVYKTTVSNLVSDTPNDWEKVYAKEGADGWFGRIDAEYDTNRLWMQVGNELNIFTDGETDPTVFGADDFTTNPAYNQLYTWDTIKTDQVAGELAKLREGSELVNNTAHLWKEIDSKTSTAPLTGGMGKNLYVTDIQYTDLDNNILAAIRPEKTTVVNAGSKAANVQVENDTATPVGIYVAPDMNVEVKTTRGLNIITKSPENGNSLTNAVWLDPSDNGGSSLTIVAGTKLKTRDLNIRVDGGMGGNGIAIAKTDRWGEDSKEAAAASTIHVEYGNVNIKGETNQDWGIGLRKDNVISRYNNTGIITKVEKGNILVDGNVDIDVYGNGIATVADDSSITVAKGGQITVPKGTDYAYYALASYGGDVAMNLGADGKTVGANDVNIDGDIFVLKKEDAADASVSLALTTANSHLSGIIDNGSTANLYLQNGAVWTNEANNSRYYQDNEDIGNGEKSRVTNFYGGSSKDAMGIINQTAKSKDLTIDNYSGHTMVTYTHDTQTPTNILGGDTTITKAAEDSSITLRTDNNGIDVSMKDTVEAVLDALAHKLYYSSYVSGERNLDGYVQIAEGLTTASVTQAVGDIEFSTTNGQGSLKADSTGGNEGSGSEGEGGNEGSGSEGEGGN
ncbi:MAG: autotransporter outer membrane beta-barrel domain-containing protein, partial [Selenomonadales bacterium]|nr:autotransporter outer membrane beta-barrel domain-containing protein [Selenomonadales bacterium]